MTTKVHRVSITLKGNIGLLEGSPTLLHKLYEKYRIKHPNAYYLRMRNRHFDGYIKYIRENGTFAIGLLPNIYEDLINAGAKVVLIDKRAKLPVTPKPVKRLGEYKLRDLQQEALDAFINNKVGGLPFYIGVMNEATNFGKTLLMAAIHESFSREIRTLVVVADSLLFKQAQEEYKKYLPGEDIQFIQGKNLKFGNFNVAMVQTLSRNIKKLANDIAQCGIALFDEADAADNKTYKEVINNLPNSVVRLGLSGSIYLSKLKKDLLKNNNLRSFFGNEVHATSKEKMMKKGYSTPIIVKVVPGNDISNKSVTYFNYREAYDKLIVFNSKAKEISLERTIYNLKYNRLPAIVVVKYIYHSKELYEFYSAKIGGQYRIERIDHSSKNKDYVLKEFAKGNIDILIITHIVKRGLNLPLATYMQNASGGKSEETILQLMGRMERRSEGKALSYLDDLYYYGQYVESHSRRRKNYYVKAKMKVINRVNKRKKKRK